MLSKNKSVIYVLEIDMSVEINEDYRRIKSYFEALLIFQTYSNLEKY